MIPDNVCATYKQTGFLPFVSPHYNQATEGANLLFVFT